jgi:hypothetical protein
MKITFSRAFKWCPDRKSLLFHAFAAAKQVRCVVTQEFLAPFAQTLDETNALAIFRDRQSEIESSFAAAIREGQDSAGEIILLA